MVEPVFTGVSVSRFSLRWYTAERHFVSCRPVAWLHALLPCKSSIPRAILENEADGELSYGVSSRLEDVLSRRLVRTVPVE